MLGCYFERLCSLFCIELTNEGNVELSQNFLKPQRTRHVVPIWQHPVAVDREQVPAPNVYGQSEDIGSAL